LAQRGDGPSNQIAAVISGDHAHTLGQRAFDFFQLAFYPVDDIERVLTVAHDDNAADDFASSIQLGHAASDVTTEMHRCDILYINRRAVLYPEDNVLDVLNLLYVATAADVMLGCCNLGNFPTHIGIARLNCPNDIAERYVVGNERIWIEIDLILLYEAANRRDLCDAFHRLERITKIPVLNRA